MIHYSNTPILHYFSTPTPKTSICILEIKPARPRQSLPMFAVSLTRFIALDKPVAEADDAVGVFRDILFVSY